MFIDIANGYSMPNITAITKLSSNSSIKDGVAFLLYDQNCWVNLDVNSLEGYPKSIKTAQGSFKRLPSTLNLTKLDSVSEIVITSEEYLLDFSVLNKNIIITLECNTTLNFVNLIKGCFYNLVFNYNGYSVLNFYNLFALPKTKNNINLETDLLYNNYSTQVFTLCYLNSLYLLVQLSLPDKAYLPADHSAITYNANFFSDSDYQLVKSTTTTIGTNYTIPLATNIHIGQDWELDLFFNLANSASENKGVLCTLGPLFVRFENNFTFKISLISSIGEELLLLNKSLENYNQVHLIINSKNNFIRIFLNGTLEVITKAVYKSTHLHSISYLGICKNVGYIPYPLQNCNKNFEGEIHGVILRNKLLYLKQHITEALYEKTLYSQLNTLVRFDLGLKDYSSNDYQVTLLSNVTTVPHLTEINAYINEYTVLDKVHHLELNNTQTDNILDFCIEAIICNTTGNTRGTILYNGDENNYNYHIGIYDNYLAFHLDNGSLALFSDVVVPVNEYVKVGVYSKDSGAIKVLFINQIEAVFNDSNNTPLYTQSTTNNKYDYKLCVKRAITQDLTEAAINTTLYPSKSRMYIAMFRITHSSRYNDSSLKDNLYTRFSY